LLLAVILSAAMSSTSSELNALASTTTIDLYKRNTPEKSDTEMVKVSRWFTLAWGIIAIGVACVANLAENLIQLVNIIGSIFYGNVLGIFLLAFFFKYVQGNAVFIAALITQVLVIALFLLNEFEYINLPFLWLNFVGCIIVMAIAFIIQSTQKTNVRTY
jgi:Na+/proline symporter